LDPSLANFGRYTISHDDDEQIETKLGAARCDLNHVLIWNAVDLERKLKSSELITTTIAFTNRSAGALRENDLASRRLPPRVSLPTTPGGAIAVASSKCRSRRNLRIRHAQDAVHAEH
jgi:hypothetical protein